MQLRFQALRKQQANAVLAADAPLEAITETSEPCAKIARTHSLCFAP
jgi:hypothetical protein